jgi:DNA (cytosine-5)-methyltransferase 1
MTDVDHPEIPAIEWCFGAGGNHLGLKRVLPTLRLVAISEIEAYAAANVVAKMEAEGVGAQRLEPTLNWTDCRTFPCQLFIDRIALFIASYPCQGESHAGKRLGPKDPRWLWPSIKRGVKIMRPLRCFFENVEGHISKGLRTVLRDLEAMGYRVACGIFSAEKVGANHRRKRIFIMADAERVAGSRHDEALHGGRHSNGEGSKNGSVNLADSDEGIVPQSRRKSEGRSGLGSTSEAVADTRLPERERRSADPNDFNRARASGGSRRAGDELADAQRTGREHGGPVAIREEHSATKYALPHFPPSPSDLKEWERILAIDPSVEPAICRVANGLAFRVDRLRLTGNGVVPDTAALAYLTLDSELAT